VRQKQYVPATARLITDAVELPLALRSIVGRAVRTGCQWRAWAEQDTVCLLVGTPVPATCKGRRTWSLHVEFYDADGRQVTHAVWMRNPSKQWELSLV
jgi:hypothetical protein